MNEKYVWIRREMDMIEKKIMQLPKGGVYQHKRKNRIEYQHEYWKNGKRQRKYVSKKHVEEMKAQIICRHRLEEYREHLSKVYEILIKKMIAEGMNPDQIWQEYQNLEAQTKMDYEEHIWKIATDYYHSNRYTTFDGQSVRSKSEALIIDRLFLNKISYQYEKKLVINGESLLPDFTFIVNGKIIIWEHVGLLNNDEYRKHWEKKREAYARAGFVEGKNLIITYESEYFDTIQVQYFIDRYLRPQI